MSIPPWGDKMIKAPSAAWAAVIFLTTLSAVAGLPRAESDNLTFQIFGETQAFQADPRQWAVVADLMVNTDSSQRLVIPNKCEGPGEDELKQLAVEAAVEESFLFIPSLCLWLETGYGETNTRVRLDRDFVLSVIRDYPSVTLYHIHVGKPVETAGYFPAYTDLIGLILMNAQFLKHSQVQIRHLAVTSLGLIDYAFVMTQRTERLMAKLVQTGLGDSLAQNLAYEFSRRTYRQDYYDAVKDCGRRTGYDPGHLADCFPIKTDNFVLNFRKQ